MKLWPRLPLPRAKARAVQLAGLAVRELEQAASNTIGEQLFAPTGGVRVEHSVLRQLRSDLETSAREAGYPAARSRGANAAFDEAVVRLLADWPIPFGEALRPEVWAWVAVELVPHLIAWRWAGRSGDVNVERFAGPLVRNGVGRLWYQGNRLDRGPESTDRWLLSINFTSDQTVALLERPTLAGNRALCLAIGESWTRLPDAERREEVFRETMKLLTIRAALVRIEVLKEESVQRLVDESFLSTLQTLGLRADANEA